MSTCTPISSPAIQSVSEASPSGVSAGTRAWVVLTHNDPLLVAQLRNLPIHNPSGLITAPQKSWSDAITTLSDAITNQEKSSDSTVQLLIVGHSAALNGSPDQQESSSGNRSIISGVKSTLAVAKQSKQDFANQVADILGHEQVCDAIQSERLIVHALFYLEYCRTYLVFDPQTQSFHPFENRLSM